MFQELMPLLAQRILLLTLSRVSDEQISVNVIPKPLKPNQRDDDAALTTPLGIIGTPKELDEQLPRQLMEFVETHLVLSSTLRSAKEQMEAAAKAAREAAKKSVTQKPHCGPSRTLKSASTQGQTATTGPRESNNSPSGSSPSQSTTSGNEAVALGPSTGSLFDVEPNN
jgi:PRTRC genetic system protein E